MPISTPPSAVVAAGLATRTVVSEASDLTGTLSSDVVYYIDGKIDMGSSSITVPEGGLTMEGAGYDISTIYSTTASSTLFVSPGGGYSGNLNLSYLTLYATGTSSQVFDLDNAGNFSSIEMLTVNLGTFGAPGTETTSLGTLDGYRQMFMNGCAIIRIEDGLELVGDVGWRGHRVGLHPARNTCGRLGVQGWHRLRCAGQHPHQHERVVDHCHDDGVRFRSCQRH